MEGRHMSEIYEPPKLMKDYYKYENSDCDISVVGRLKSHIDFWESFGCSSYVLDIIRKGYVIPVLGDIQPAILKNNKSSRIRPKFVRKEIDDLLHKGAIVECINPPSVVNPLTVAEKEGKCRLVIDLRHINKRLVKTKYKFEGHDTAKQFLTEDSFMSVFDLKSGYHHISVVGSQHDLLGFSFPDWKGNTRYFKFIVLPFGLATAGLVFTKVLREMIKLWRSQRIQAVAFLEDGLQANIGWTLTRQHALQIKGSLLSAGWIPHKTKSQWVPSQVLTWLGFIIDLVQGKIFCTPKRIEKTKRLINKILKQKTTHVKLLSKVSGCITSMERSHGDLAFLFTRFMGLAIAEAPTWNWNLTLERTRILAKESGKGKQHANTHASCFGPSFLLRCQRQRLCLSSNASTKSQKTNCHKGVLTGRTTHQQHRKRAAGCLTRPNSFSRQAKTQSNILVHRQQKCRQDSEARVDESILAKSRTGNIQNRKTQQHLPTSYLDSQISKRRRPIFGLE